jgi:hypothetical protein
MTFGQPGDIPAPADFDGDGRCDPAVVRPRARADGTSLWYAPDLGGGAALFQTFSGLPGDIPAPADYDGDGKADAVSFRPSTGLWSGPRSAGGVLQLVLGQDGDIPIPADYDGDGIIDPATFRPSTGLFFGTTADGARVVVREVFAVEDGDIPTGQRPHYAGAYPY